MFKHIKLQTIFIASILLTVSCTKDDPKHVHEEELITKVILTFTNQADSSVSEFVWSDDHAGEDDPDHGDEEHTVIELAPNSTYSVEVKLENASDPNAVEDITIEVIKEADEHFIFFDIIDLDYLTIASATDDYKDSSDNPLHIKTVWTTTAAAMGNVVVYLIHEPTSKTGMTRNDFGGETDVQVDYEVHIE